MSLHHDSYPEGSVAAILSSALQAFSEPLVKKVMDIELCLPSSIPKSTEALWTSSTTSCPQILLSKDCWNVDIPSTTQLIFSTLDIIAAAKNTGKASYSVFKRGELDTKVDPRTPIAQLIEPKATNPVSILGLNVECMPDNAISPPLALSEYVEPFDTSDQQLLLTPKYVHTDLHLDSADGLSIPLGSCVKLWMCFPPTPKNLKLFAEAEGQKAKLARIGKHLEGGIMYTTTSDNAIYLPVGCLHTVFTLSGGYLIAIDFNSPKSCGALASMISFGLDFSGGMSNSFQQVVFSRLLASVDFALNNNAVKEGLSAWIAAQNRIADFKLGNEAWELESDKMWEEWFEIPFAKKVTCPCGKQVKESFKGHWMKRHCRKRSPELKEAASVEASRTRSAKRKAATEAEVEEGEDQIVKKTKKAKKARSR